MLGTEVAARFADAWYAAWNAHDLDAMLAHYADAIEFVSPFVAVLNDDPAGIVRGKDDLRAYFARGLERFPDLAFEPLEVLVGVSSVTLRYISVGGRYAAEVMTLDADGLVVHCLAHYRDA